MPFVAEVPGGKKVSLMDLPLEKLGEAARAGDIDWFDMLNAPAHETRSAIVLYKAACEFAGVEPPDGSTWTVGQALEAFTLVPNDDLPTMMESGLPKEEAAPTTPGSSGPFTTSE